MVISTISQLPTMCQAFYVSYPIKFSQQHCEVCYTFMGDQAGT